MTDDRPFLIVPASWSDWEVAEAQAIADTMPECRNALLVRAERIPVASAEHLRELRRAFRPQPRRVPRKLKKRGVRLPERAALTMADIERSLVALRKAGATFAPSLAVTICNHAHFEYAPDEQCPGCGAPGTGERLH